MQLTEKKSEQISNYSLLEITEMLIKHKGLHEGLYNLSVEFQIAVGAVGPAPDLICPGAMLGVSRIGISKTEEDKRNHLTVDAAEVNPARKRRKTNKSTS